MYDARSEDSWKLYRTGHLIIKKRKNAKKYKKNFFLRIGVSFYLQDDELYMEMVKNFEDELIDAFEMEDVGVIALVLNGIFKKPFREYSIYTNNESLENTGLSNLVQKYSDLHIDVFGNIDRRWKEYNSF